MTRDDGLDYWPVGRRYVVVLALLLVAVVVVVELGAIGFAYERLGLSRYWIYTTLALSIVGSRVNLALARLPSRLERIDSIVVVHGIPYVVPVVVRSDETVVAVNLGGAVVPLALSVYLMIHQRLGWRAVGAVVLVAAIAFLVARPIQGVGIVVPTLVPPAAAVLAGVLLGGSAPAATAFVGGTIGTLVGADLLHLPGISRAGAPVVSIGGAGTFDGIFVTGIVAVLFAFR